MKSKILFMLLIYYSLLFSSNGGDYFTIEQDVNNDYIITNDHFIFFEDNNDLHNPDYLQWYPENQWGYININPEVGVCPDNMTEEQALDELESACGSWDSAMYHNDMEYSLSYLTGCYVEGEAILLSFNDDTEYWGRYVPGHAGLVGYIDIFDQNRMKFTYDYYDPEFEPYQAQAELHQENYIHAYLNCTPSYIDKWHTNYYIKPDGEYYILKVATHELGHTLGLSHLYVEDEYGNVDYDGQDIMLPYGAHNEDCYPTDNDEEFLAKLYKNDGTETDDSNILPVNNALVNNFPNPFNPTTTISYNLGTKVVNPKIEIFNIKGQKVKSFVLEEKSGKNSVVWNGTDRQAKKVSSGVYFYRLQNNNKTIETKKMLMLK